MSMALFFSMNVVGSRYNEACFKAAIQESIGKWVLLNPLAKSSILHKQQTVYSKVGFWTKDQPIKKNVPAQTAKKTMHWHQPINVYLLWFRMMYIFCYELELLSGTWCGEYWVPRNVNGSRGPLCEEIGMDEYNILWSFQPN